MLDYFAYLTWSQFEVRSSIVMLFSFDWNHENLGLLFWQRFEFLHYSVLISLHFVDPFFIMLSRLSALFSGNRTFLCNSWIAPILHFPLLSQNWAGALMLISCSSDSRGPEPLDSDCKVSAFHWSGFSFDGIPNQQMTRNLRSFTQWIRGGAEKVELSQAS